MFDLAFLSVPDVIFLSFAGFTFLLIWSLLLLDHLKKKGILEDTIRDIKQAIYFIVLVVAVVGIMAWIFG